MVDAAGSELLLTSGTLQLDQVRLDAFGCMIAGDADVLPAVTIDHAEIADPQVSLATTSP